MGLFSSRNIRKAKDLLDKNRHKVGGVVEKAGDQLDKVSKGKTSSVTSKATEAAKKYSSGSSATHHGIDSPNLPPPGQGNGSYDAAEAQRAQAQAAGAVAGAANALTNFMNKAAEKIEQAEPQKQPTSSDDEIPRDEFDKG